MQQVLCTTGMVWEVCISNVSVYTAPRLVNLLKPVLIGEMVPSQLGGLGEPTCDNLNVVDKLTDLIVNWISQQQVAEGYEQIYMS
jgi:hypothetical protein